MGAPDEPTDFELIKASMRRPEVFGLLVDRYGERLLRYLTRRVGASIGEDLASETFLLAFQARHRYQAQASTALPWLYGIGTNLVRNHVRSERTRSDLLGKLAGQQELDDHAERVDDALAAAAQLHYLAGVFAALSPEFRDVLFLIAVEELSYEDCAAALTIPVGTVRSRLSRARTALREALAEPDLSPPVRGGLPMSPQRRSR